MNYHEMIELITQAKKEYYQNGHSKLTDAEYDRLVAQAEKLGYTETVGAVPVEEIKKISHEHPMLSLDKCHTIEEITSFIDNKDVVFMSKADGLTVSCTYENGDLVRLETRGNGAVGNDIMFHADSIKNLPKHLPIPEAEMPKRYVIDGECVILKHDFEKINCKLPEGEQFSNARNLAAGSLNLLDPNISAERCLMFYAWDVIEGGKFDSFLRNLQQAYLHGFSIVPVYTIGGTKNYGLQVENHDVQNYINSIQDDSENLGIPIDGVVIKYNNIAYGKSLGMTAHHPRNAIAYKFTDESYATKLKYVDWQLGKTGRITPVANFEPVEIDGSVVEKASLHNISILKSLGLTNGCTVYVKKANQIIPQIVSADPDGDGEITPPEFCPVCGQPTLTADSVTDWSSTTEVLFCVNKDCRGKLLNKYVTFASKKGMDVKGLSEATLEMLLNGGYLTAEFSSLYRLSDSKRKLYNIPRLGKKSVDNLLEAIENSKDVDLVHFLTAFSIDGIGEGQSKLIVGKYPTFAEFREACDNNKDFSSIQGIGPIMNDNIHRWWRDNSHIMIDVAEMMRFKGDFMNAPEGGDFPLLGKTFVITGSLNHYKNRDELKSEIEKLGGKVVGAVSKNTGYLINNDTASISGKNKKAKELGIPIISEAQFIEYGEGLRWRC